MIIHGQGCTELLRERRKFLLTATSLTSTRMYTHRPNNYKYISSTLHYYWYTACYCFVRHEYNLESAKSKLCSKSQDIR